MADAEATPLISVVMPIYNAASFLPQCLASVQAQTHQNLDVICIDDGSTDTSPVIVKEAMAQDNRIRLFSTDGGGPGHARNLGLDQVRGEYLAFVDADDTVPVHALDRMLATARGTGSDIVTGRVVRLTGTHTWPSALHERAIPRPKLRTHITSSRSLLYDTTSWNKLFVTDLWRAHGLRYPEGVLYEDVQVMLEAHCRARSVDMISDVIYHWRRRDDGTLSITQQRLQLNNLEDRMTSLRVVRTLLNDLGTAKLQSAWIYKSLVNDVRLYLRDLLRADRAYQECFVTLVSEYLSDIPESVMRRLSPQLSIEYHLVRAGQLDPLLELLEHAQETSGRLRAVRRGLSMHLDVGPVTASVPSAITRVRRRLPLRAGVDAVYGSNDNLVVEGYAFIDSVPVTTPLSQIRRLQLQDHACKRSLTVWLKPHRHERVTPRYGQPRTAYTWSGFRAEIPVRQLAPPIGSTTASWTVAVQSLSPLAAKGSTLGPPVAGAAWFPPVYRTPSGLVCSVSWGQDHRLRLNVHRSAGSVVAATVTDHRLVLELRLAAGSGRGCEHLLLRSVGAEPITADLEYPDGPDGTRAVAAFNLADIIAIRESSPFAVLDVALAAPSGPLRLDTDLDREIVASATATDTVLVRGDSTGRAEVAVTSPRVAVTEARWAGDRLVLGGIVTLPAGQLAGLEWRNSRGERLYGVEQRDGDRFQSTFEPFAMPGPEGIHPLSSGSWGLYRREPLTGQVTRAFVARGYQVGVEAAHQNQPVDVHLWVDRYSLVTMVVHALDVVERGAFAQEELRRGPYRRSRNSPLRAAVLFESWQGKQFSDNPRALAEEALRRGDTRELLVSVRDRSVVTPPGLRPVLRWSREYYQALATSRTVIANDSMTPHFTKRKGQSYLQTWHGTPLKKIGFDIETIQFRNRRYLQELGLEIRKWDRLLSPSAYTTEILRSAFRFDGEIVETGYPRNDLLLSADAEAVREQTRRWLGIPPGKTVVLWAPTWRDNQFGEGRGYAFPMVLDIARLARKLGDDHVILFRGHHLISDSLREMSGDDGFFVNVSHHPDIRDLYCASDVLVTDYSSTMFDYALTGRPILHLVWDLATYRDQLRGFYVDLAEIAPGPLLENGDELALALTELSEISRQYAERYQAFRDRFCALEDGRASSRVWDLM
jgi:CDP-glycerol glycerophosphotransferase